MSVPATELFELGDVPLCCGHTIPAARLGFLQIGTLNADRSNLVLVPTSYGARPEDLAWLAGPVLDPERWCIVIAGMFGNGVSSSPSHGGMGLAEQGWVLHHPDWVERICCVCGTARTSPHNRLFLLSLRQALTADPHWTGSGFRGVPEQGLRTYALIYASWAASQPWFRSLEEPVEQHVEERWLPLYRRHDPRDLIAMLDTWLAHDVADGGDLNHVLKGLQARAAVVACDRDLYFTVEDMAAEAAALPDADFHVLRSTLGHRAGNPHSSPPEQQWLRQIVEQLLDG
jgi:homoserine O-acetyltransferase